MKEEDAKNKTCPFINKLVNIDNASTGEIKYRSESINCKGSNCMAWRNNDCVRLK